jgi:hypothetical protein
MGVLPPRQSQLYSFVNGYKRAELQKQSRFLLSQLFSRISLVGQGLAQ